jgi:hypothetical protein
VTKYVARGNPAGTVAPFNPIYNMPSGDYRNGTTTPPDTFQRGYGPTGYQAPREIRLGVKFMF